MYMDFNAGRPRKTEGFWKENVKKNNVCPYRDLQMGEWRMRFNTTLIKQEMYRRWPCKENARRLGMDNFVREDGNLKRPPGRLRSESLGRNNIVTYGLTRSGKWLWSVEVNIFGRLVSKAVDKKIITNTMYELWKAEMTTWRHRA